MRRAPWERTVRAMRTSKCRSRSLCGSKPRSARILASISPDSSQFSRVGVRTGWFLAKVRRNLCSEGPTTPRSNSARTTDDRRITPSTDSILFRWRPVRASSTSTDVSKMTTSLIESGKLEFAGVLLHQGFEALQRNDFAQSDVNGVSTGFRLEDSHGLVGQVRVQAD